MTEANPVVTEAIKTEPTAPEQAPAQAAPAIETPKEEKKEETLSPRFAALARKEKYLTKQAQEMKAMKAELDAKLAQIKEWEGISNPLEALKKKGFSYEDVTNYVLNDQKLTPELEVKGMKEQMTKWMQEQESKQTQSQAEAKAKAEAEMQKTIENFKNQVNEFVTQNADKYELINLHEQQEMVFATIEEYYNKTGKIMTNTEASDLVESYLEEQIDKSLKTKKLQSKLAPKVEEKNVKEPSKTITNIPTSAAPSMLPVKTENDRLKRALAALG